MAPIYEKAAKENPHDYIHFGKVDATSETALANRYDVHGYPRLLFKSNDGEMKLYSGKRTLADLRMWTQRMSEPAVSVLESEDELTRSLRGEKVVFVLCGEEHEDIYNAVAMDLRASIRFMKLFKCPSSWNLGNSFVAKYEKGEKPLSAPKEVTQSETSMSDWIQDNRFPLVNILDRNNFNLITKTEGRKTVISVIDLSDTKELEKTKARLLRLARPDKTPLSAKAQEVYRFGILDGVRWERFVKQFFITPDMLPHVFVLDGHADQFYNERDMQGQIETFLEDVISGKVYAQREGVMGIPGRALLFLQTFDVSIVKEQPAVLALLGGITTILVSVTVYCFMECGAVKKKEKITLNATNGKKHE